MSKDIIPAAIFFIFSWIIIIFAYVIYGIFYILTLGHIKKILEEDDSYLYGDWPKEETERLVAR